MGNRRHPGWADFPLDPHTLEVLRWEGLDAGTRALLERVREAVDRLPPLERDLINALFFERVAKSEYARRQGWNRPMVERVRQRAIDSLEWMLRNDADLSAALDLLGE